MLKPLTLAAGLAAVALSTAPAMAQNSTTSNSNGQIASKGSMMVGKKGSMAMTPKGGKMTDTDKMMVKNCMGMSHDKMMADKECQGYMKEHPDWMKSSGK